MEFVCPFLSCTKVPNFEYISDEDSNVIDKYFTKIEQDIVGGKTLVNTFNELSQYMRKSDDLQLRALGSQIGFTASMMRKYNSR